MRRYNIIAIFVMLLFGAIWYVPMPDNDSISIESIGGEIVALPSATIQPTTLTYTWLGTWYKPLYAHIDSHEAVVNLSAPVTDLDAVTPLTRVDIEAVKGFEDDLEMAQIYAAVTIFSPALRPVAITANIPVTDLVG